MDIKALPGVSVIEQKLVTDSCLQPGALCAFGVRWLLGHCVTFAQPCPTPVAKEFPPFCNAVLAPPQTFAQLVFVPPLGGKACACS